MLFSSSRWRQYNFFKASHPCSSCTAHHHYHYCIFTAGSFFGDTSYQKCNYPSTQLLQRYVAITKSTNIKHMHTEFSIKSSEHDIQLSGQHLYHLLQRGHCVCTLFVLPCGTSSCGTVHCLVHIYHVQSPLMDKAEAWFHLLHAVLFTIQMTSPVNWDSASTYFNIITHRLRIASHDVLCQSHYNGPLWPQQSGSWRYSC